MEAILKNSISMVLLSQKILLFLELPMLLKIFFIFKKKINHAVQYIENFNPDIVFSVDSPDFVFQVIKKIRSE